MTMKMYLGPMTIAMLMRNTLNLARHAASLPRLKLRLDREPATKDELELASKVAKTAELPRQNTRRRFIALTALSGFVVGVVAGMALVRGKVVSS